VNSQSATNLALIRNIGFNVLVMAGYRSLSDGIGAMGAQIHKLWGLLSQPPNRVFRFG
jgi:hypothetical protein